jgi:hypothetical protein
MKQAEEPGTLGINMKLAVLQRDESDEDDLPKKLNHEFKTRIWK